MRKYVFLVLMAFAFALVHACSLNNDILKPDCEIFEVELTNKWWEPVGNKQAAKLMFEEGKIKMAGSDANKSYTLSNCNTVTVQDNDSGSSETWTIEDLNLDRLTLRSAAGSVQYVPAR